MLVTDMPCIFPDRATELNATEKKSDDKQSCENAHEKFTNSRRKSWMTKRRLCNHSRNKKPETDSTVSSNLYSKLCLSNRDSLQRQPYERKGLRVASREFDFESP